MNDQFIPCVFMYDITNDDYDVIDNQLIYINKCYHALKRKLQKIQQL